MYVGVASWIQKTILVYRVKKCEYFIEKSKDRFQGKHLIYTQQAQPIGAVVALAGSIAGICLDL